MHLYETLGTFTFLGQLTELAPSLWSLTVAAEMEAQRRAGAAGSQIEVDQAADHSLRLSGIILRDLGAHG